MSKDGASYVPESPVVTSRVAFVSTFVIVTVAPCTTAPVLSVTVPTIVALFVWAVAGIATTPSKKVKVAALTDRVAIFRMMDILEPRKKIGSTLSQIRKKLPQPLLQMHGPMRSARWLSA